MFGEVGNPWKIFPNKIIKRWQELISDMLYAKSRAVLGIYGGADKISFLEIVQENGLWAMGRRAEENWQRPQDFGEMATLLAERCAMRLAREGWENLPMALCLPEEEFICKLFPMAAGIPREEQNTAVYWEIDNYLQSCGLTLETVKCTSARLPGEEMVEALIILKEKIHLLEKAFGSKGGRLKGVFPETPMLTECRFLAGGWQVGGEQLVGGGSPSDKDSAEGERRSLYAAAALLGIGSNRWPDNLLADGTDETPWNYEMIGRLAMIFVVLVIAAALTVDLGELYNASQAANETRQQMAELDSARQVMERDRKISSLAERKESCLTKLTEKSRPLDSVLIHLGTVTVEGARIVELDCTQENFLLMRGEAVDYSALGEVMEAFEKDKEFFPSAPLLEDSRQKADENGVEFRLKIDMYM